MHLHTYLCGAGICASVCDPSVCDPSVCDPSVCDQSVCVCGLCVCMGVWSNRKDKRKEIVVTKAKYLLIQIAVNGSEILTHF